MKTPEDEAFEDIERKQREWGGGFPAKRQMAIDKFTAEIHEEYIKYRTAQDGKCKLCIDGCIACDARVQPAQEPERKALKLAEQSIKDLMHVLAEGRITGDDYQPEELEAFTVLDSIKEALAQPAQEPEMLTIAYQSGYHDGKKAALAGREWNFCERCGKRTADKTTIHTCTPPQGAA